MKVPLTVESFIHEQGHSFGLRDRKDDLIARYMTKDDAELIAYLVNKDYKDYWAEKKKGLPELSDMNEVDAARSDDEE